MGAGDVRYAVKTFCEHVLLPHGCAGRLVQRLDRTLVVGEIEVPIVQRQPAEAAEIARPGQRSPQRVETRDAAQVRRRAYPPLADAGQAGAVDDALERGR